jgi:hypothetical protein
MRNEGRLLDYTERKILDERENVQISNGRWTKKHFQVFLSDFNEFWTVDPVSCSSEKAHHHIYFYYCWWWWSKITHVVKVVIVFLFLKNILSKVIRLLIDWITISKLWMILSTKVSYNHTSITFDIRWLEKYIHLNCTLFFSRYDEIHFTTSVQKTNFWQRLTLNMFMENFLNFI